MAYIKIIKWMATILTEPGRCVICGKQCPLYLITCCDEHHEQLIYELEQEYGVFKKVTDSTTGKSYKVPTRDIVEVGLKWADLKKYEEWSESA